MAGGLARDDRYSMGAIVFHWTIAVLVIVNLFLGLFHESLLEGVRVIPAHKSIGVLVLILSLGRLAWRLTHRPPTLPDHMPGWEERFAKAVHWIFYALMILLPLTGWALSSNPERPRPPDLFGLLTLPRLPIDGRAAGLGHAVHGPLGYLMTALVVLHVVAALRHHFLMRDKVLVRMLPWVSRHG